VADTPRIPWAQTISTRDSTMAADAIMYNYYATKNSDGRVFSERRFGIQPSITVTAGAALGLFAFGTHVLEVVGTTFYSDGVANGTVDGTSQYQFTLTGQGGTAVFLKNNAKAYTWNGTVLTQVTDVNYPAVTVPGVAWLDGYVFVLTPGGILTNSNLNTPATWAALNTINGSLSPDPGACVTRLYNYVASFGTFSTTFFYDAGNTPPGSPLLPNISAVVNVGCAVGTSMVASENTLFWVGQTHQKGRKVYTMNGLSPQPISDEFIEKILNADALVASTVYAYYIEINGGAFYVLTLTGSNCTLVYNAQAGMWSRWSTSALGTPQVAAGASEANGIVTVNLPNHGLNNPAVVKITSSNSSPMFLGTVVVNVIDVNTITYSPNPAALVGGINDNTINTFTINAESVGAGTTTGLGQLTVTPWLQNFFNPLFYTFANNTDYLLGATNGITYQMQQGVSSDNGVFIYGLLRSNAGDFGSNNEKFFPHIEVIADKVQDTAYVGYSDNDFVTFGSFRPVNLGADRSMLKRCAASRRRAFSLLYIGGFQVRFYQLELPNMQEGPL
jgi:hypothetical protein